MQRSTEHVQRCRWLLPACLAAVLLQRAAEAAGGIEENFVTVNEEWLEDSKDMTTDFLHTPAVDHIRKGRLGDLDASEIGFDAGAALERAAASTQSRCAHTIKLALDAKGRLPRRRALKACRHRKLDLLFTLEPGLDAVPDPNGPNATVSQWASVNSRLFAYAAALRKRGHRITIAAPEDLQQLDLTQAKKLFSAVIVVKTLGRAFDALRETGVPLIWDHIDSWDSLPLYELTLWKHKRTFAGVFTGNRMLSAAFDTAGVRNVVLYHQHNNWAGFHRPDRSPPVRVLSLQGDFRTDDLDIFPLLEGYSQKHNLTFRHGKYTGHGRDIAELAAVLAPEAQDWGDQLKYVMGMSSVDVAVLWPKNYGQFDVCYKPTSRLSQFASLGIPVVSYPFNSYLDLFVEHGYPLVAQTLPELEALLDRLRESPALRQEASKIMLRIADALSVKALVNDYERGLCDFLDGAKKAGKT